VSVPRDVVSFSSYTPTSDHFRANPHIVTTSCQDVRRDSSISTCCHACQPFPPRAFAHRPTGNRRKANACVIFCHRVDIKPPRAKATTVHSVTLLIMRHQVRCNLPVINAD